MAREATLSKGRRIDTPFRDSTNRPLPEEHWDDVARGVVGGCHGADGPLAKLGAAMHRMTAMELPRAPTRIPRERLFASPSPPVSSPSSLGHARGRLLDDHQDDVAKGVNGGCGPSLTCTCMQVQVSLGMLREVGAMHHLTGNKLARAPTRIPRQRLFPRRRRPSRVRRV
jgi:hypothetical protein